MDPVEGSLWVGKAGFQAAKDIRIRRNAETDAVYHTRKPDIRLGQKVGVGTHTGRNVLQVALAKVGHGPPDPRIDQRKYLLTDMSIGALRNSQVGYAGVKGCVDSAVVEIIAGGLHGGSSSAALVDQRFKRGDGVPGLLVLRLALFENRLRPFVLRYG